LQFVIQKGIKEKKHKGLGGPSALPWGGSCRGKGTFLTVGVTGKHGPTENAIPMGRKQVGTRGRGCLRGVWSQAWVRKLLLQTKTLRFYGTRRAQVYVLNPWRVEVL